MLSDLFLTGQNLVAIDSEQGVIQDLSEGSAGFIWEQKDVPQVNFFFT